MSFRYAICNETFEGWDHARVCGLVSDLGYAGLELAPFTLAPRITDVTPEQRRLLRRQADDCGLTLLGLHWLLARTEGLHLTAPDVATRQRTADYLAELGIKVPKQLSVVGFDDGPAAEHAAPPLTTVAQPNEEKGRLAARWLMDDIERGAAPAGRREQILSTELVVRESTAAPPGK